jgi:hypothetical protein
MVMATSMAKRPKSASLDHGDEGMDSASGVWLDATSVKGEARLALDLYCSGNGRLTAI